MARKTTRIEPTLSGDNHHHEPLRESTHKNASSTSAQRTNTGRNLKRKKLNENTWQRLLTDLLAHDIIKNGKSKALTLITNRKFNFIILGVFVFLVITSLLITSNDETTDQAIETETEFNEAVITDSINLSNRSHQVTLPDNFSLLATDYNGIVIHWQGDNSDQTKLWDIHTTDGDKKCQAVTFNNGESYRTLNVLVENGNEVFANFSPLDTLAIIKAVALRGNFTLCGYKFSLKGSQAALGKHYFYSDMLSY